MTAANPSDLESQRKGKKMKKSAIRFINDLADAVSPLGKHTSDLYNLLRCKKRDIDFALAACPIFELIKDGQARIVRIRPGERFKVSKIRFGKAFDEWCDSVKSDLKLIIESHPDGINIDTMRTRHPTHIRWAALNEMVKDGDVLLFKRPKCGLNEHRYFPPSSYEQHEMLLKRHSFHGRKEKPKYITCAYGMTMFLARRHFKFLLDHHVEDVKQIAAMAEFFFVGPRVPFGEFCRIVSRRLYHLARDNGWQRKKHVWSRPDSVEFDDSRQYKDYIDAR